MSVLAIAWVVLTPYCTGMIVGNWPGPNRIVCHHLTAATVIGWTAVAALFTAVFVVGGASGAIIALSVAPLVGLAFWTPGPRGNGGSEPRDRPDAPRPPANRADRPGESSHHRRHHGRGRNLGQRHLERR